MNGLIGTAFNRYRLNCFCSICVRHYIVERQGLRHLGRLSQVSKLRIRSTGKFHVSKRYDHVKRYPKRGVGSSA
jgi:hypothetical protein